MKKIISLLLIAVFMLSTLGVNAADWAVDRATGVITVSGNTNAGVRVMLLVLKPNKTVSDLENGELIDSVDYINQTTSTGTGSFVFTFPSHSGDEFGRLAAFVNDKNELSAVEDLEIEYYTNKTAGVMSENMIDLTEAELVFDMLTTDVITLLELDATYYSLLTDTQKLAVCQEIADMTTGEQQDLQNLFFDESLVAYANGITDVESLFELLEADAAMEDTLGFTRESDTYKGLNNVDELKTRILGFAPFADVEDLKTKASAAFALTAIHNYKYTYMEDILRTYDTALGIDITKLTSSNETSVYKGIAGKDYADADAFAEDYDSLAVKSTGKKPTTSGGGGSSLSGGFSGAGKGAAAVQTPPVTAVPETNNGFSDLPSDHYAADAVASLVEKGVISGYPDGTFLPEKDVIRTEIIKMLVVAFEIEKADKEIGEFTDLTADDWYYEYCTAAITNGILNGISETEIGANMPVTREDACVLLYRVIKNLGIELETKEEITFGDESEISDYALESVMAFAGAGIVSGDGENFNPKNAASRGECAKIIYNVLTEVLQ